MIILVTSSLEFYLGGSITTNQLPFIASYTDITTTTFTPAEANGISNNTTAVTLLSAPAASTQRKLQYLSVYNADTVASVVYVQLNNSGTLRLIGKFDLAVGARLEYNDVVGFRIILKDGTIGSASGGGSSYITSKSNTADILLDVTGGDLSAEFASHDISQFTNDSGFVDEADVIAIAAAL